MKYSKVTSCQRSVCLKCSDSDNHDTEIDSLERKEEVGLSTEIEWEQREEIGAEVLKEMTVRKNQPKIKEPLKFWERKIFTVPVTDHWPAPVSCKMNISEWETLMKEVGLERDIQYITNGFRNGFCLGIPQHGIPGIPWYTPENHRSALTARKEIENTLKKEKEAGRIMGPYTHQEVRDRFGFFRSNPMGGAVNGDGSVRMVNDLSFPKKDKSIPSVNSFVDKLNYGTYWDDFDKVALFFQDNPGEWECAIFDWQKAYRQLPAHPSQRKYLCILDFEGRVWIDLAVGFGGVASCGVFGAPAHVWKIVIEKILGFPKIFRWVDDNLILRRPGTLASLRDVTAISKGLGVETNPLKNHEFASEQRYVGFVWNARDHTVRLPEDKLLERRRLIENLLEDGREWTYDRIESLVGKLVHTVYIVPHMKAYLRSLYRWLKDWVNKAATRRTPDYVKADLEEWNNCLHNFNSRALIPAPRAQEIEWVGDASSSFGIGVLIGSKWACFQLAKNWQLLGSVGSKRSIAWAETVAVRMGLLVLSTLRQVGGQIVFPETGRREMTSGRILTRVAG